MEQCERNRKRNTGAKSGAGMRRKGGDAQKASEETPGCSIALLIGIPLLLVLAVWFGTRQIKKLLYEEKPVMAYEVKYVAQAPDYQVELLDYNEYSRPGTALSQVKRHRDPLYCEPGHDGGAEPQLF